MAPQRRVAGQHIRSGISAAINSAVYGGSFGTAFVNGVVADAAATGTNGIGDWSYSADGNNANLVENFVAHSLLGCAARSSSSDGVTSTILFSRTAYPNTGRRHRRLHCRQ
ncbi:DUF637 domain-containing protein [Herbaspirillum frisingense]|uniref:DUF637 domain-containing protein n=1 Tax=Herbaspirillum frisingense TaxID=92645 RepID=UPI00398C3F9E|nr:DUF637 domain-containing protein [Herbaspirillum frisingense]